ncbi:unnamed protein product [Effrenium voratum]|uniref:Uncharacterized protein n=1 Tax=Effrenium voratum TaxID=2562239 RepID=A0AA36NHL8_9DINO|nr:unnamed protein product [Effrenium voratum]CAJ1460757.1 unnamed protein product [Effrenium voratum]
MDLLGREEVYSFAYADALRRGVRISEKLHVDKFSGRFTWTRGQESEEKDEKVKCQGSSYLLSHVSSVRFTTRLGDPNSEFWTAAQKLVRHKKIRTLSTGPVLSLLVMIFNVLTLTLVLAACLAHAMWLVFPRVEGNYDMSQGPDSEALGAASALAVLTALCATAAGWWLGIFRCRCGRFRGFARASLGVAERLGDQVAARYRIQRPFTGAVLFVWILWCFFLVVLCPVAYGLSRRTECGPGSCAPEPGSPLLPTCGVGNCSCGGLADLTCVLATTGQDLSICKNVKQPMCTASPLEPASGVQMPLLAAAVGSTALAVLLGLAWLLNTWCLYAGWMRSPRDVVMLPQIMYHRFSVNFRSRQEKKLIFTLGAEDDPLAVAAALMPQCHRPSAIMYQAPGMMTGTYMPIMPGSPGTGSEWATGYNMPPAAGESGYEPKWC